MKEIHAYQNDDGTYRVEIIGAKFVEKTLGKGTIRETTESKMEVPRAQINITALPPCDDDERKIFTLTIEQENKYE